MKFKNNYGPNFELVDLNKKDHPSWMTRAFINHRYIVMINDNSKTTKGAAIRAMIKKHDGNPIPGHWSEIQKIKNEIFGKEAVAVEFYPKESELVNEKNIYWIWIFEEDILPLPIIS